MNGLCRRRFFSSLCALTFLGACPAAAQDPLQSWNEGPVKHAILQFVAEVTRQGSRTFVPLEQRIAVFDNDGTLWVEQPIYTQFAFAIARVRALAPKHAEWKQQQPFEAVLEGDMKALGASGEKGLAQVMLAAQAGTTIDEYEALVKDWVTTAKHPRFHRTYTECVYEPMLEVLAYFRANGFKTYIVSGGDVEFMRPWVEPVYGIPPEQTIGSSMKTELAMRNGRPVLMQLPAIDFIDDQAGKPVAINKFIGRRPIAAFGNSDGDQQMLEWTAAGAGRHLTVLVHHTDGVREYAYDRHSSVGMLNKALEEATAKSWPVVDMKRDWTIVFPKIR